MRLRTDRAHAAVLPGERRPKVDLRPSRMKPRIFLHKNGQAVLSGLDWQTLTHILCIADLYAYESVAEWEKTHRPAKVQDMDNYRNQGDESMASCVAGNIAMEDAWHKNLRQVFTLLKAAEREHHWHAAPEKYPSLKARLKAKQAKRKEDEDFFKRLMSSLRESKGKEGTV